ncbi:serine hydroxymethyltransferase [Vibrio europaeus]|uniref:serine hydroxymethyltransferase n=1 Tax=Vibrio europaeus TaxID=300876 RepID=UPI0018A75A94|nr:serine hydroxymethyltransferase [Vibrio europaeus]MDC5808214.1 serine hydroxymethyltransferase [Vibrio europaeus]QPG38233.1 serine hydroxymethyltransferase [Vibrio europaeus]
MKILEISDLEVQELVSREEARQQSTLSMLASENIQTKNSLLAQSSLFANKTLEGYPGKRFHAGGQLADQLELLCIDRAKALFGCQYANVQAHSGSQANHIVYNALLAPGDAVLALSLDAGGHLSHGAKVNQTSALYRFQHYGVDDGDLIDYAQIQELAHRHQPKIILCGGSSYTREIDFSAIADIANSVGAYLFVDMAHFAGQVAAGRYSNPLEYADIATTTLYKSLAGPRGAIILAQSSDIGARIDRSLFPGYQGTPSINNIAAKAICLHEASTQEFKSYIDLSISLAKQLCFTLKNRGLELVTDGTDTSMVLVDLRQQMISGKQASDLLERCGIIVNHNVAPNDTRSVMEGSAVRLSTNVMARRRIKDDNAQIIFDIIADVFISLIQEIPFDFKAASETVAHICQRHPVASVLSIEHMEPELSVVA